MYADSEADFPLERCLRVLPHHNDTGGFFVAVLEKTAELPRRRVSACAAVTGLPECQELTQPVLLHPSKACACREWLHGSMCGGFFVAVLKKTAELPRR